MPTNKTQSKKETKASTKKTKKKADTKGANVDTTNLDGEEDWDKIYSSRDALLNSLETGKASPIPTVSDKKIGIYTSSLRGIFGMPYQFSSIVDPTIQDDSGEIPVGTKYADKILSVMPILFLTPGEPEFMAGFGKNAKNKLAQKVLLTMEGNDGDASKINDNDEGRYYSFKSNFKEYKKYANTSLRALAFFMGIQDCSIPVPGSSKMVKLRHIDIEKFMNNDFTKLFGSFATVPFFLEAETAISEDYSNDSSESMLSQTANGFSQTAREIQFVMGGKDRGGMVKALGDALTDAGDAIAEAFGDVAEAVAGKNLLSRISGELTTIVSGGKIVFPEFWSDSSYSKSYSINLKLRSPDPDPVSIYLNIYMPIILLQSMAGARQLNNSSNSYESPFLVRATYKSIFNCDLGLISSLSITKGGPDRWNVMGHPVTADVTISIKDLYSQMFISKAAGLLNNTAQMDYLATMAGIDLNSYEPTRMIKLGYLLIENRVRDIPSEMWGGIKQGLNRKIGGVLSHFSDTRALGI